LERARKIIYLADNAGEIVFDKLLLETILSRYEIGKIIFVVKATPIINDAMYEDATYVGIDKIPNIEFMEIEAGSDSGITRESKTFLDMLEESYIVISKGQGNYESLSDVDGIFFLLMAKCPVIAKRPRGRDGRYHLEGILSGRRKEKVKNDDKTDLNAFVEEIEAKILEEEREIYTERTLKEANDPKNLGEIKGANGFGKVTGPCGDTMQICLKIEDDKITGSKFLTDGCGSSIACGSVITELAKVKVSKRR
jgi:Uncharacterized conserved protein